MSIVALTGGIASGKTAACKRFTALGVPLVDTDTISHQITATGGTATPMIKQSFGQSYINSEGALDRTKMRNLVFADTAAKQQLEAIMHPLIRSQAMEMIKQNQQLLATKPNNHYQVVVVPLLFETNYYAQFADFSVVIDCSPAQQIARAMERSNLSEGTVKSIMRNQLPRDKRLALADFVIENDGAIDALNVKIDALHAILNHSCHKIGSRLTADK